MQLLVVAHDHASPEDPIGEPFTEHGYDVVRHLVVPAEHFSAPVSLPPFRRSTPSTPSS